MSDPLSTAGYGSPSYRGTAGQSLAEQPTTVVPVDRYEPLDGDPYASGPVPHDLPFDERYDGDASALDDRSLYDDHFADDLDDPAGERPWYAADADEDADEDEDDDDNLPVAVRRADTVAGLLLLLAGMAAGVSLLVVWVNGGVTGLELVRDGIIDVRSGRPAAWQPLAVVGGGVALFVLGLLMYAPARTHRFLGVLALLVSLPAAAGVLVPLADANWQPAPFAVGASFAVAVGALGLLGALKALSTGPRWTPTPRPAPRGRG